jgi:hypothetical protein
MHWTGVNHAWKHIDVVLILAHLGALPRWPHSRQWGYVPTGGVGGIHTVVAVLVLLAQI